MIFVHQAPAPAFFTAFVQDFLRGRDRSPAQLARDSIAYPRDVEQALYRALHQQFSGKCAYCEYPLDFSNKGHIEQFRPKRLYGAHASLDWSNLLLACAVCNRNKRARFPLLGDEMEPERAYPNRLRHEQPLLLHPCIDQPDEHLRFSSDGMVHGVTERGNVSIALLDLNRMQLVAARASAIAELMRVPADARAALVTHQTPYAASLMHALRSLESKAFVGEIRKASTRQVRFYEASAPVATDRGEGLDGYQAYERYIERVELRNIGPLAALDLDLLAEAEERTPGFVLLGENGIGKSTILRSIACALAGPAYARKLRLTSNSLLAAGARTGSIMVRVSGYPEPITVTLRRGRPLAYSTRDGKALVLAYGASRLLAAGRHKAENGERHAKIRNLFDPFVPVGDASAWLDTIGAGRLDDVRATLEHILNEAPAGPVRVVHVQEGGLRFAIGGGVPRPVAALSDGYKSLIGIAGDIMAVMHAAHFETMAEAMGIVLIDELGNHFHPQLKLRIVGALRTAFPKIQFIYTTHEPLCLRGMGSGEIAVLRRDEQGVYLLTGLPEVATMRIDQLLASEHFGLGSTVDPARVAEIKRYHMLVSSTERDAAEEEELRALRNTLAQTEYLGGSRRERMLLSLLDMHDGELPRMPGNAVDVREMSARTRKRLSQILEAVSPAVHPGKGAA